MNLDADKLHRQINELELCINKLKDAYLLCNHVMIFLEKDYNDSSLLFKDHEYSEPIIIEPQIYIYKQQIKLNNILEKKRKQYLKIK
jgi:hypothetical protein